MSQERPKPRITAQILQDIGLFDGLDEESLSLLARELPTEHAETGDVVVEEGDTTQKMFVVVDGELKVVKRAPNDADLRVAMFGPGDWFGEMSILDVQPRSATVRAVAPTLLIRISAEHVDRLLYRRDMASHSRFMTNMAKELSRRLWVADRILTHFVSSVTDTYVTRSGSHKASEKK